MFHQETKLQTRLENKDSGKNLEMETNMMEEKWILVWLCRVEVLSWMKNFASIIR